MTPASFVFPNALEYLLLAAAGIFHIFLIIGVIRLFWESFHD